MNESYVLILNAVVLSVGNFALWWTLFDEIFIDRINVYEENNHNQLKKNNLEHVDNLRESNNLVQDGLKNDNMTNSFIIKYTVRNEARALQKRTIWVYYFALGAILFAAVGLLIPKGMVFSNSLTIYMTSFSWWILVMGVLCMLGLIIHYQLIDQKIVKPTEGKRIRSNTGLKSFLDLLKSKLPI